MLDICSCIRFETNDFASYVASSPLRLDSSHRQPTAKRVCFVTHMTSIYTVDLRRVRVGCFGLRHFVPRFLSLPTDFLNNDCSELCALSKHTSTKSFQRHSKVQCRRKCYRRSGLVLDHIRTESNCSHFKEGSGTSHRSHGYIGIPRRRASCSITKSEGCAGRRCAAVSSTIIVSVPRTSSARKRSNPSQQSELCSSHRRKALIVSPIYAYS
jgi:hypothetical protein